MRRAALRMGVLIVDDHVAVCQALGLLLVRRGFAVVGTVASGKDALAVVRRAHPSVALIDIFLPDTDGFALTRQLRVACPRTAVLLMTGAPDDGALARAWRAGARGLVSKADDTQHIVQAVRQVGLGGAYVTTLLGRSPAPPAPTSDSAVRLTAREREVLRFVADGRTLRIAAATLGISPRTAEHHLENMRRKVGIRSAVELVRYAIRRGWIGA